MNLVNEKDIVGFEVGENGGQITSPLNGRSGCASEIHPQFMSNDLGQRGLTQARRTEQEYVVERFASMDCRLDGDSQAFLDFRLSDELLSVLGRRLFSTDRSASFNDGSRK